MTEMMKRSIMERLNLKELNELIYSEDSLSVKPGSFYFTMEPITNIPICMVSYCFDFDLMDSFLAVLSKQIGRDYAILCPQSDDCSVIIVDRNSLSISKKCKICLVSGTHTLFTKSQCRSKMESFLEDSSQEI